MLYFRHVIVQVESRRMFLPMQRQKFSKPGRQFTVREVASFNGTLVSSFPVVEFWPLKACSNALYTHYTTLDFV